MRLPLALSMGLALFTIPAHADPATDYASLRELMPTLHFGVGSAEHLMLNARIIQSMAGNWAEVSLMMQDGATFPDADDLALICERYSFAVEPKDNLGLTMTLPVKPKPLVVHLTYAWGTSYIATAEEAGLLAWLAPGESFDDLSVDTVATALRGNIWQGYMSLTPVGDDLVLLQPLASAPILLARCP